MKGFRERKKRITKLNRALKKLFPKVGIALHYRNFWELLVSVILSAQCTDKMVNKITQTLFKKYKTLGDYVKANPQEFEQDIRSCGYYRAKTKNILGAAKMLAREFGGRIPKTMEEILKLPGVARKTANVVLGNAHGVIEGIAVDTHVRRFAVRFDLSQHQDPVRIERDLVELLPKKEWFPFTYRVIAYGRTIAPARRYDTSKDPLVKVYGKAATRFRV